MKNRRDQPFEILQPKSNKVLHIELEDDAYQLSPVIHFANVFYDSRPNTLCTLGMMGQGNPLYNESTMQYHEMHLQFIISRFVRV